MTIELIIRGEDHEAVERIANAVASRLAHPSVKVNESRRAHVGDILLSRCRLAEGGGRAESTREVIRAYPGNPGVRKPDGSSVCFPAAEYVWPDGAEVVV